VFHAASHPDAIHHAALDEILERPGQVLRADAVYAGAQATGDVERDDALAFGGRSLGQPVHQMYLGADGEDGALRRETMPRIF
jgi:hypothetical protein